MSDYILPEAPAAEPTLLSRVTAPVQSTSITAVDAGIWILAAALGIPATLELSRLFATIVVSLFLGH
jgi:hypothetical protein